MTCSDFKDALNKMTAGKEWSRQTEYKGQSRGKEKRDQSVTGEGLLENSLIQSNTYICILKKKKKSFSTVCKTAKEKVAIITTNWLILV